jgi:hypothetical protein
MTDTAAVLALLPNLKQKTDEVYYRFHQFHDLHAAMKLIATNTPAYVHRQAFVTEATKKINEACSKLDEILEILGPRQD